MRDDPASVKTLPGDTAGRLVGNSLLGVVLPLPDVTSIAVALDPRIEPDRQSRGECVD